MRNTLLGAFCALFLSGCGSGPDSPEGYLTEKPGALPPDRTALRVAQQYAPDGVSNQVRVMLLYNALQARKKAPGSKWEVQPDRGVFRVTATLTATGRPDTTFAWQVDFQKPPAQVCQPANQEAIMLNNVHIKLDETNLKDFFLDGPPTPTPGGTPGP